MEEALLRWNHPKLGTVLSGEFIIPAQFLMYQLGNLQDKNLGWTGNAWCI